MNTNNPSSHDLLLTDRGLTFLTFLRKNSEGFTLIELIMTIVILSFSTLIIIPFFNAIVHSPDPIMRQRAVSLGQSMMDEISSKKWDENTRSGGGPAITTETVDSGECDSGNRIACYRNTHPGYSAQMASQALGPDPGEERVAYDDIDDYHGIVEENGEFTSQSGNTFILKGYQRRVDVRYIESSLNEISHSTSAVNGITDSKLIVVTVTSPTDEQFYFSAVKCNL